MAFLSTSAGTEMLASKSRIQTNPDKHKIFLCHSGAQKNFVRYLDRELRRVHQFSFFDEDDDSLRKGEVFPDQLFEAAAQCHLAIVVLSEDFFTRSKWPMLELDVFLKKEKQILPLYYGLSTLELKDGTRQAKWFRQWEEWSEQGSHTISIEIWKKNLKALYPVLGLECSRFDNNDVKFIDEIVAAVCKLVPYLKWDDSHVKGKEFLISETDRLFASCPPSKPFGAHILGLHGIGGLGKSLLCNCLCNHYYAKYVGKVSVVELPGHGNMAKPMECIRQVMRVLTGARDELLNSFYDKEMGFSMLNERIRRCNVFLAIDNVWDDFESQEVATSFMQLRFNSASRVLVTARNKQALLNLGIDEMCCFGMPTIPEKDATELFLHHVRPFQTMANLSPERQIYVQQHVYQCYFLNGAKKEYHPFALKVLGGRCAQIINNPAPIPSLKVVELISPKDGARAVFNILKTSYEALPDEEYRLKFMDIALFYRDEMVMYHWPIEISISKLLECLMLYYEEDPEKILGQIEFLKSNFLFEMADGNGFRVHDLYLEFAKNEAQKQDLDNKKCLSINCSTAGFNRQVPRFMTKPRPNLPWPLRRLHVSNVNQGWSTLELKYYSNLELLHLENCDGKSGVLDLSGVICLRHLRLVTCEFKAIYGLPDLPYLVRMDLVYVDVLEPISSDDIILLELQHLQLVNSKLREGGNWGCPTLTKMLVHDCDEFWPVVEGQNLRTLSVTHSFAYNGITLEDFPNLQVIHMDCDPAAEQLKPLPYNSPASLRSLFYGSEILGKQIIGLDRMRRVRDLSLHAMPELNALDGIENCMELSRFSVSSCFKLLFFSTQLVHWTCLEELRIYLCSKLEVVNIGPLPTLKKLSIEWCRNLQQLPDLTYSPGLQSCIIKECGNAVKSLNTAECLPFLEEFEISMCAGLKTLANVRLQSSLKLFRISSCIELVALPDLTASRALEKYEINSCFMLETVGKLGSPSLKSFSVSECSRLLELPDLVDSQALEEYEVQSCQDLQVLGKLGPVPALRSFKVGGCNRLMNLPDLIYSQALEEYQVRGCKNLKILGKLGRVQALRSFKYEGWHRGLVEFPDLTDSQVLEEFEVQCSESMQIVLKLGPVPALRSFKVEGFKGLLELPNLEDSHSLEAYEVRYLEKLETLGKLGPMPALKSFNVEGCNTLVELPNHIDPQLLEKYEIRSCGNLRSSGNLGPVPALRFFKIEGCKKLVELPELKNPVQLQEYEVRFCEDLQTAGELGPVPGLRSFKIEGCKRLVALPELKNPVKLQEYEVRFCEDLQTAGKLGPVPALRSFKVEECDQLVALPDLVDPQALEEYEVRGCKTLQTLGNLGPVPSLKSFKVERCANLVEISCFQHTEALKVFEVIRCQSLKNMGNLTVKALKIVECPALIKKFTKSRAELVKAWKLEREKELWAEASRLQEGHWGPNWRQIVGSSMEEVYGSNWRQTYASLLDIQ